MKKRTRAATSGIIEEGVNDDAATSLAVNESDSTRRRSLLDEAVAKANDDEDHSEPLITEEGFDRSLFTRVIRGGTHDVSNPRAWKELCRDSDNDIIIYMQPVCRGYMRLHPVNTMIKVAQLSSGKILSKTISVRCRPGQRGGHVHIDTFQFIDEAWDGSNIPFAVMDHLVLAYKGNGSAPLVKKFIVSLADSKRRAFLKNYGFKYDGIKDYYYFLSWYDSELGSFEEEEPED
jgi:hypothetical protein